MALVRAWNTRSGEWQSIPDHWIGHPVLGADFSPTKPSDVDAPEETTKPTRKAGRKEAQDA